MPVSPVQTAFSAGELGEEMHGRIDLPIYAHGLKLCRNWQPFPQGLLARRNGTQDVCAMPDDTNYRLVEFRTSKGLRFVIGLGEQAARVYDETGDINGGGGGDGPGPELLTNGHFDDSSGWTLNGLATISGGQLTANTTRTVAEPPDAERGLPALYRYTFGSGRQVVAVATPGIYQVGFRVVSMTSLRKAAITVQDDATSAILFSTVVSAPGVYSFQTPALAAGNYRITVGGEFYETYATAAHSTVVLDDASFNYAGVAAASLDAPWTKEQVGAIHTVLETGRDVLWLFHPNVETRQLRRDAVSGLWSMNTVTWVGKPAEWADTNWPGTGELYQGRMYASATPDEPSQVWASKSGAPEDFTAGAEPADGFSFKAQTKGAIRWLRGAAPAALIIGTDEGEYFATAQAGVLMPSDVQVEPASAFASSSVQATRVGHRVVYASIDGTKLRAMQFARDVENWISHDLTFTAPKLFAGGVKEIHFTREPLPMLLAVLGTGEVRACVVDEAAQVVAPWRLDTSGFIRSAVVLNGPDGSTVWLGVERQNGARLERWTIGADELVQVDAWVRKTIPEDLTISGLEHLEGEEVEIIIDGALEPRQTVAGGELVLERAGTEVVIGLPFTARATGLPKDVRGGKARSPKLAVQVIDSALPKVNGWRPADRTPATPQDQAEPQRTGKVKVRSLGWDDEAKFDLEQDLPFRTKVVSVFEVTQVNQA